MADQTIRIQDLVNPETASKTGRGWKVLCAFLGTVILILSLAQLMVVNGFQPNWLYIAKNSSAVNGNALLVIDDPYMTDVAVMNWAGRAVSEVRTMGYSNFEQRILNDYPVYFTDAGYQEFVDKILVNNYVEQMTTNKQNYIAVNTNQPVIVWKGWVGARYNWIVQVKLGIGVEVLGGGTPPLKSKTVTVRIEMMDKSQRPAGLAIDNWFEAGG